MLCPTEFSTVGLGVSLRPGRYMLHHVVFPVLVPPLSKKRLYLSLPPVELMPHMVHLAIFSFIPLHSNYLWTLSSWVHMSATFYVSSVRSSANAGAEVLTPESSCMFPFLSALSQYRRGPVGASECLPELLPSGHICPRCLHRVNRH